MLQLFGTTEHLPRILVQSTTAYFALLIFARLLGAKQVGQLTFFHYAVGITIGSIAGTTAMSREVSALEGVASIAVIALLAYLTSLAGLKSRGLRGWLEGRPVILVKNGQIMERNLGRARLNFDDLTALLRAKGAFELADVEFALLETTGDLSLLRKSQRQPLTPADLNVPTDYHGLSAKLVMEGRVLHDSLARLHLTEKWLHAQLGAMGLNISDVAYAELTTTGELYVDRKRDTIK